jgi:hypothetical protein
MEASSTPNTEQQEADLDAINALRESATVELKVHTIPIISSSFIF